MKNNLYLELTDRTKQIFKAVVESYLETGSPSGSETVLKRAGLDISSSSVRSILSHLLKALIDHVKKYMDCLILDLFPQYLFL